MTKPPKIDKRKIFVKNPTPEQIAEVTPINLPVGGKSPFILRSPRVAFLPRSEVKKIEFR